MKVKRGTKNSLLFKADRDLPVLTLPLIFNSYPIGDVSKLPCILNEQSNTAMPAQRLFTNLYILARCTIRFSYPLIGTGDRYLMSQRDVLELLKWWTPPDSNWTLGFMKPPLHHKASASRVVMILN